VTLQEAQEMARSVQQLMEIQRFAIDSGQRLVLMRDRVSKVIPAHALLYQLLHARPQVAIEVELVAIPKTVSLSAGIGVPSAYPIVSLVKTLSLAGGPLAFGLGIGAAELLASWTKGTGTSLLKADMRASDGIQATFHAGEKYPILTMGWVGSVDPGDPNVFAPPPSFNFEDLGLVLKVTPKVHDRHEVSLDIEAEYKLLGNATSTGNPIISSRRFANRVRLRFDQWAIIAGLIGSSSSVNRTGLAGVMSIPVLGAVLSRNTWLKDENETLLVIKPRLLNLPPSEFVTREIYIGAESRLRTPL
jgi:Flp pilus assembly secretin CpaC